MHGVTRSVTFPLSAERTASGIYALADLPIQFSEWNIANPSVGGFVTTDNSGTLEVLVFLTTGAGNPATTATGGSSRKAGRAGHPVRSPSRAPPFPRSPSPG